ncbi:MAG: hypothetical protein WCE79_07775 [Xanthobacteraceae bacterium]
MGALIVLLSGEVLLVVAGLETPARLPVAVVTGAVATSLVLLAGVLLTGLTAGTVFVGWILAVVAAVLVLGRDVLRAQMRTDLVDAVAIACLAILVGFWSRHCAAAIPELKATGILPSWSDYYIHGAVIAQFGSPLAVGRGTLELADQPLPFYHYGSYMLAAAIGRLVDLPGLGLANSVLLPLGLLLAAIGSYALATALADRRAAVIAAGFLMVLPDPSFYGLANGFLAFHWNLFTHPGAGYALGAAAVSLVCLAPWFERRDWRALGLGLALAAATFQLRAHVFLWLMPAIVATLALSTAFARRHRRAIAAAGIAGIALVLVLALTITPLRDLWLGRTWVREVMDLIHRAQEPTGYPGLYDSLVGSLGIGPAAILGTLLIVPGVLGVFTVLYPLLLVLVVRQARRAMAARQAPPQPMDLFPLRLGPLDLFPLLLLLLLLLFVLFAWGAPTTLFEIKHRAVVLLYQVFAIWTAAYLSRAMFASRSSDEAALPYLAAIVVAAVAVGLAFDVDPARPRFAWGKQYYRVAAAPGVVDAAAHLRASARPGDTAAIGPIDDKAYFGDPATQIASLTDVPNYLARAALYGKTAGGRAEVVEQRLRQLRAVEASSDLSSAEGLLRAAGITWYVAFGPAGPGFDPARAHAIAVTPNSAIYLLRPR